jgi:putative MATE family efflux protein
MLGSLAQNIIGVIDISFLGRVGEAQLGASGLAGIYYFIMVLIGFGFNGGMQIVIARRIGEGKEKEAGHVFDHEFYIILVVGFFQFMLMHFFSFGILRFIIHSDDIYKYASVFLFYRSYGIFFALLNSFCQAFFVAIGKTKVLNISTPILLLVNTLLDYALIFGHWGLPQWGVKGAAIASSVAELSVTVFYFIFLYVSGDVKKYNLFRFVKFSMDEVLKLLNLSGPLVFQYLISICTWFGFFIVIENLGELPLAASNVMRGIYIFCGIPCWALGATANSMVSNLIGQRRQNDVIYLIKKIITLCFSVILVLCLLLFLLPSAITGIFTNDPLIIAQTILIIPTVIVALLVMSFAFICIFAVTGTGSTRVGLMIEITAIAVYIIYTYLAAYQFHLALRYIWGAEVVYWVVTFIICSLFLKSGKWKKVVV